LQEVGYDPKSPSGILVEVDGMSTVRVNSNLKALGAAEERTNIVFKETRTVSGTGEKVELAREDLSRASCQQVEEYQRNLGLTRTGPVKLWAFGLTPKPNCRLKASPTVNGCL
jgi:hypothetical protein